jgi:hypothetical protein
MRHFVPSNFLHPENAVVLPHRVTGDTIAGVQTNFAHVVWLILLRRFALACLHISVGFSLIQFSLVCAQDLGLSPTRPTIANSATIQERGVLQMEAGVDAYPGDQQTVGTLLSYALLQNLRLDLAWAPFSRQDFEGGSLNGVGTVQVGGKVVVFEEKPHSAVPGLALQYEAELPSASRQELQGFGQQIILLVNHHYGRDGIFDLILNGSLVQSDCQTREGCSYGGQQSAALSYHVRERTRLYAEVFGQNNSESNTPPGLYCFGGFFQKFSDSVGIDGGLRFGVTRHSPRIGATVGLVLGHRLRGERRSEQQP